MIFPVNLLTFASVARSNEEKQFSVKRQQIREFSANKS
jgi:hypothetical protein